jgi:hypothetical protein
LKFGLFSCYGLCISCSHIGFGTMSCPVFCSICKRTNGRFLKMLSNSSWCLFIVEHYINSVNSVQLTSTWVWFNKTPFCNALWIFATNVLYYKVYNIALQHTNMCTEHLLLLSSADQVCTWHSLKTEFCAHEFLHGQSYCKFAVWIRSALACVASGRS